MTSCCPALTWAVLIRFATWMAMMPSLTDRPGSSACGDLGERLPRPDGDRVAGLEGAGAARQPQPEDGRQDGGGQDEEDEPPAGGEPEPTVGRGGCPGAAGDDDQPGPPGCGGPDLAEVGGLPRDRAHHVLHPGGQGHRRTGVR